MHKNIFCNEILFIRDISIVIYSKDCLIQYVSAVMSTTDFKYSKNVIYFIYSIRLYSIFG